MVVAWLGLAACATFPEQERHREIAISREASSLRLPDSRFDPEVAQHRVAADRVTGKIIETVNYRDDNAFLVVQLRRGELGPGFTQRSLDAMLEDWVREVPVLPHETNQREDESGVAVELSTFRVDEWDAECLGFREAGTVVTGAPEGQRNGVLFGVFCEDGKEPLSLASAEEMLLSIRLRGSRLPQPKPTPPTVVQPAPMFACQACGPGA